MSLFSILTRISTAQVVISLLLGAFAGISYALLIPLVNSSFADNQGFTVVASAPKTFLGLEVSNYQFAALFLISCVVIFVARTLSQVLLTWAAIDATSKLKTDYYHRIVKAPLVDLERVGSSKLIASITTDVQKIISGAEVIPDILISAVTLVGMMTFLLFLNTDVFYFVCGAVVFGAVTFQIPVIIAGVFFDNARERVDELQEGIRANIYGAKELKLCAQKRESFFADILLKSENDVRLANKKGSTIIRAAMNYGDMISFFIIGYIAFIFINYNAISIPETISAIMVLLYITGPIAILMNSMPEISLAQISLRKVNRLFTNLPEEQINREIKPIPQWQQLSFNNVVYQYPAIDKNQKAIDTAAFTVGPLNFALNKGEVTFIIGGNGSGKSTLSKMLTGYYTPKSGEIQLGEQVIDDDWVTSYRNSISAIFTDYYLFDRLLGNSKNADSATIDKYMKLLKLDEKVQIKDGHFSTLALSDGQRKRLALLVSFLEDKEIYLFDEWAADQDPMFKDIFYNHILPDLRGQDKIIIVISHDDRYFGIADQMLVMEQGKLKEVRRGA